jgi:hypothetical protein
VNSESQAGILRVLEEGLGIEVRHVGVPQSLADRVDYLCEAQVEGRIWPLAIEIKSSPGRHGKDIKHRQVDLRRRWPDLIPILASPRLSKKEGEILRELEINHLDFGGRLWIRSPGLFVNIEGKRGVARSPERRRGRNPFSKRASLVARVLLESPSQVWRVRALSREASLSVGYVSEILKALVAREYATPIEGGFRLAQPGALLRDWAAVYSWEDNGIRSYFAPFEKDELVRRGWGLLEEMRMFPMLTLLAGLDQSMGYVVHDQVHFFATELAYEAEKRFMEELHAEPVSQGGNLHVLRPYYGPAVRYGANVRGPVPVVSDIQLFLDLVHFPVRGPEAASVLLRKRMRKRLGLARVDMETLEGGLGL